ncbi:MAG: hypothetical protein U0R49_12890 [Fimbriimonadales bacterium]
MLQNRAKLVFALFAVVGVANLLIPEPVFATKTEEWMLANLPESVKGYSFVGNIKMGQINYDQLKPFGIVSRSYTGLDGRSYDYLVIASNSKDSFHDQRVCLTSQQYQLRDLDIQNVDIPALGGSVPATVTNLVRSDANGSAMIFYIGPYGFRPNPTQIPFDITRAKLFFKTDIHTLMYQFKVSPAGKSLEEDAKALATFADSLLKGTSAMPEGEFFVPKR